MHMCNNQWFRWDMDPQILKREGFRLLFAQFLQKNFHRKGSQLREQFRICHWRGFFRQFSGQMCLMIWCSCLSTILFWYINVVLFQLCILTKSFLHKHVNPSKFYGHSSSVTICKYIIGPLLLCRTCTSTVMASNLIGHIKLFLSCWRYFC